MASTVCFSFTDSQPQHHTTTHFNPNPKQTLQGPFLLFPKPTRYTLTLCHSPSTSPPTLQHQHQHQHQDPLRTGRILSNRELQKLQFLENYEYHQQLESGSISIRVMKKQEMDMTAGLLSESFAASMLLPTGYVTLMGFLVKQYLIERRFVLPHTATLVAFYTEGDVELALAGTVEVRFDKRGANATSPPTPPAPNNSPYVCNMAVKKHLRRRGIGWHLLKASEELISRTCSSRDVYLHCRMIDEAPFNMYMKAGYNVVKTDSLVVLLTAQRRKHLMCKQLPLLNTPSETYDAPS